jgi:hypothetical protein
MEETRYEYVSLTGNVHKERDQCGNVMTVGRGVRDCEDVDYGVQNHVKWRGLVLVVLNFRTSCNPQIVCPVLGHTGVLHQVENIMKHTFSSGRVSEVHNISSSSGRWL